MDVTRSISAFTALDVVVQLCLQAKLHVARAHLGMDLVRMGQTASNALKDISVMWAFAVDVLQDEAQVQTFQRVLHVVQGSFHQQVKPVYVVPTAWNRSFRTQLDVFSVHQESMETRTRSGVSLAKQVVIPTEWHPNVRHA